MKYLWLIAFIPSWYIGWISLTRPFSYLLHRLHPIRLHFTPLCSRCKSPYFKQCSHFGTASYWYFKCPGQPGHLRNASLLALLWPLVLPLVLVGIVARYQFVALSYPFRAPYHWHLAQIQHEEQVEQWIKERQARITALEKSLNL